MAEALDWIGQLVERRQPTYLVTANLDFAAQASTDEHLQRILVEAELVLCDGMPLLWASRLTKHPLQERVAGSDLIPKLAGRAAAEGWRIFLLGAEEQSLENATKNLKKKHPDLIIAGTYSPPFAPLHEMNHEEIARRIKEAAPDILLVALGCPKQEKWIYQHYRSLGVPCSIGVGATIDFLAGKVHRAPPWIAAIGLEWVFRLVQEPRRLAGRYLADIVFLVSQFIRERQGAIISSLSPQSSAPQKIIIERDLEILRWSGPLIVGTVDRMSVPSYNGPFIVDISGVTLIDSHGLGHLLQILRKAWKHGVVCCYLSPATKVRSIMEMTRLERVIPTASTIKGALKLLNQEQLGNTPPPVVDHDKRSILLFMPQHVTGETTKECQAELALEWNRYPGLHTLQLDFGSTQIIDNAGLGFILHCRQLVSERAEASLKILRISPKVLSAVRAARLESLLGISPTGTP